MNHTCDRCCDPRPAPHELGHPAIVANDLISRIVGIAGVGPGDEVMVLGAVDTAIDSAVSARGAHLLPAATAAATAEGHPWPLRGQPRADALLWAVNKDHPAALVETLATLRDVLRTGGRRVLWMPLDGCCFETAGVEAMQRSFASAGFASVIVGRLASPSSDILVATGILRLKTKQPN